MEITQSTPAWTVRLSQRPPGTVDAGKVALISTPLTNVTRTIGGQ